MKQIPRRKLIPLITDLLEYRKAANHTISYTKKMMDTYGEVCEVSFTGIRNYFIHDPEVIKEILTTQSHKMKRPPLFRAFRKFLGHGLFTSDGDYHRQQRRLIKPAFYPQKVEGYANLMVQCALDEIAGWKENELLNLNQAMTRITLQVIMRTMFGSELDRQTIEQVEKSLKQTFEVMNRIVQNPLYMYCLDKGIPLPLIRKFYKLKAGLDKVIYRIIDSHRKDDNTEKMDLLSMLIEARDEDTGTSMSNEQIRDEVITFFLAGHETTTLALTWTFYLIAKHPEKEQKFYAEIKNILHERLPKASDYQLLPFTRNIFKESLRLYPPAWTFAREPIEDVVIRDYHFPKGAVLWTITYLLHHSEKYFYRPEEFIPERWDEEKIKELPKYAYFPFGGGNRMCIGEGFAWMEGILVLATIASRYRLRLPENFSAEIHPLFSLKTKDPILMKVIRV